jgi:hypothetical protein
LADGLEREGERVEVWFSFFFQTPFRTLQTSLNPKTMHLNYDAQELIDSKIIKMIFKYLKAKFI